jgi:lipopolysaccharide/colanic/teichoic acid biosynthesis glycosyltransferase
MQQRGWRLAVKRAADVSLAGAALAVTAPALGAAALAVRTVMGAPVLFRQQRPGRGGALFTVYKLRTMTVGAGSDAARLTPLGKLLRATSLDELPQLWNVLRGDMSLVGPRPLLVSYLARYSPEQRRRHDVLPGITGWAQINGRNTVTHEQKFRLDVWYVDHWSLALDARILATTLWRVLARAGISAEGHATMPEFQGTPPDEHSERA